MQDLNRRASTICASMIERADELRIGVSRTTERATLLDCGIKASGGLEAGRLLAEVCMAGLGRVSFVPGQPDLWPGPAVQVATDHPLLACMASQYAGWKLQGEKFFAMGSGPMRSIAAQEPIFAKFDMKLSESQAIGVLESRKAPPDAVIRTIAEDCGLAPENVLLCVVPTSSLAGMTQVVARSVETALHKLYELDFDLRTIESAYGIAPLPPPAADDMASIGRTNDAILYGSEVTLYVRAEETLLEAVGPKVPSSSSKDYGQPFADLFARAGGDFYAIDPHLFSPAVVTLTSLISGRSFRFGHTLPRVIHSSFMP